MLAGVVIVNANRVALGFLHDAETIHPKMRALVTHHGHLLRTRVMANASGRPGPNVVTGDYRRSIELRVTDMGGEVTAIVGTNLPQGRRLEFGFVGADSLGRIYNQPPYPHFGPAFDEVSPKFIQAVEVLVNTL